MYVLCVCQCWWRSQEGVESPGAGVTVSWYLLSVLGTEFECSESEEQEVFLLFFLPSFFAFVFLKEGFSV